MAWYTTEVPLLHPVLLQSMAVDPPRLLVCRRRHRRLLLVLLPLLVDPRPQAHLDLDASLPMVLVP